MATNETWDALVLVVRRLLDRQNGPPIRGKFCIADQVSLDAIKACFNSSENTNLYLIDNENPESLSIGKTIEVEVSPRIGFGLLVKDVSELLRIQTARLKEPNHFLLLEESICNSDSVGDDHPLSRYRAVLRFIQTLKRAAAFLDRDECAFIFINDGKFTIPIDYSVQELNTLSLPDLFSLTSILPEDTHEKQCCVIMAQAVVDMTKTQPSHSRFQYLLANLPDLKKRYEEGYKLFTSGFSYEKIRDQVEAAKVEYTGKIHKVISDIQNQLLTIPAATIVVATQMKSAKDVGYEFWVNLAVLFSCLVFAIFLIFLLYNQYLTLDVLRDEIKRQERQLKQDFASIAESFSDTFTHLSQRVSVQQKILWTILIIVTFSFLLSLCLYIKLTWPVRDWLINRLPWLVRFL